MRSRVILGKSLEGFPMKAGWQKSWIRQWVGRNDSTGWWFNERYCFSYSPLLVFFRTVNPAFLASEIESGLSLIGELKLEISFFTGFLHRGQLVSGVAERGRLRVNCPPQTLQLPSFSAYS